MHIDCLSLSVVSGTDCQCQIDSGIRFGLYLLYGQSICEYCIAVGSNNWMLFLSWKLYLSVLLISAWNGPSGLDALWIAVSHWCPLLR